jgi:serine/threonine protein kinase
MLKWLEGGSLRTRGHVQLAELERIGAYEVRGLRGRGAMASVYEGRHAALGRTSALKLMHAHLARDPIVTERFLREARALCRVNHPNVVDVFDVGDHHGAPYLVMSLVDGDDLGEHLRHHHPMTVAAVADLLLPVIAAVAAAYDAGIVDRDLMPRNIRISHDHRGLLTPKVLDFGIAKLTGDEAGEKVVEAGGILGTASYVAPEQLCSTKHVHARSDVYALGVILYEAATGRRPFEGRSARDLMQAIFTAPIAPPSSFRPELLASFDAIVLRAMCRDPYERFASARELGHALAAYASDPEAWLGELGPSSDTRVAAQRSSGIRLGKRTTR